MFCLWHKVNGCWHFWAQRKDLVMWRSQGALRIACSESFLKEEMVGRMKVPGVPGSSKLDTFPFSTPSLLPAYFPPILSFLGPEFTDFSHSRSSAYLCCVQCNRTIRTIYLLTWCLWPCLRTFSHPVSSHIHKDTLLSNLIPDSESLASNSEVKKVGDGAKECCLESVHL